MIDFDRMALLWYPLAFVLGWKITSRAICAAAPSFIQAGLKGNDMGRKDRPEVFFFLKNFRKSPEFMNFRALTILSPRLFLGTRVFGSNFSCGIFGVMRGQFASYAS